MSAICNAPFRLLMQELGAGGAVSELISCHGINHGNDKTMKMLWIDHREKNTGLQLFGEDAISMAKAAYIAVNNNLKQGGGIPRFIDINMGCPVRKVVAKGGGAALLREPQKLKKFFSSIKKNIDIPLSIKIRTGWDASDINAQEVIRIAAGEGIAFVAVHGRTRAQQYQGKADWGLIEELGNLSPLPIIGNGDLHSSAQVFQRLQETKLPALMLARGALRRPFLFLTSFLDPKKTHFFSAKDYFAVLSRYRQLLQEYDQSLRIQLVQLRKMILWFSTGFPRAGVFRKNLYEYSNLDDLWKAVSEFFYNAEEKNENKEIKDDRVFMAGGHG